MGSSRRQHHRQQEAMRAANTEANQQKAMMEQQQRAMEAQLKAQREAMMAQTKAMTEAMEPDKMIPSTLDASNVGVRTGRSTRKTVRNIGKGVASLRIPLNIGTQSGSSGLNIP